MAKAPTTQKSITKSELFAQLAEASGHSKAEVKSFFEALTSVVLKNLGKNGAGVLTLPGLFKLRSVKKPAVKGGKSGLAPSSNCPPPGSTPVPAFSAFEQPTVARGGLFLFAIFPLVAIPSILPKSVLLWSIDAILIIVRRRTG
ncbi:MAG: HU family DNA-binding protein [Planctomycetes bacterium]|nr:HU family DNA-binding protein [Planctomycetota bacterium]